MNKLSRRACQVALGYLLDQLFGEPPASAHPLKAFGALMAKLEGRLYSPKRLPGVAYALCGLAVGAATGVALPPVAIAVYVATAGKALAEAAGAVAEALGQGDLDLARARLKALVGRDTEALSEAEVVRAVVESVAENTNDALVAPLAFALAFGAPGAYCYRCANTLDSLVGYRSPRYERFGWASARLDDLAGYVPARLTALAVAAARPRRWREILAAARQGARAHPSPNAGVAEAAFAAALGRSLGGTNCYQGRPEQRPTLGRGPLPSRPDIERAVKLSKDVGALVTLSGLALPMVALPAARAVAKHRQSANCRRPSEGTK